MVEWGFKTQWDRVRAVGVAFHISGYNLHPWFVRLSSSFAKRGDALNSIKTLDIMKEIGVNRTDYLYSSIIKEVANTGGVEILLGLIEMARDDGVPLQILYNSALQRLSRRQLLKEMLLLRESMESDGTPQDSYTFNAFLAYYTKAGKKDELLHTFEEMKRTIGVDAHAYSQIISFFALGGDLQSAEEYLNRMWQEGIDETPNVYSNFFTLLGRLGESDKFVHYLKIMRKRGIEPDLTLYGSLVGISLKFHKTNLAVQLFDQMKSQGIAPDPFILSSMILMHAKLGNKEAVVDLLNQKSKESAQLTSYSLTSVLDKNIFFQTVKAQQRILTTLLEVAEHHLYELKEDKTKRKLLSTILRICARIGDIPTAIQLFKQNFSFLSEGIGPLNVVLELIDKYEHKIFVNVAREIWVAIQSNSQLKPTLETYEFLLSIFYYDVEMTNAIRERVVKDGIPLFSLPTRFKPPKRK